MGANVGNFQTALRANRMPVNGSSPLAGECQAASLHGTTSQAKPSQAKPSQAKPSLNALKAPAKEVEK
jgi:hypothetical protein